MNVKKKKKSSEKQKGSSELSPGTALHFIYFVVMACMKKKLSPTFFLMYVKLNKKLVKFDFYKPLNTIKVQNS